MIPAALLFALAVQSGATSLPAGSASLFTTAGRGVQIYTCSGQAGPPAWTLKAPDAKLFDTKTGEQVATHGAGPRWTWRDGSTVTGKLLQKTASPDPASIPWLLLEAEHAGSPRGALTPVTFIRRTETQGGNPPAAGCDAGHLGAAASIPYSATYTFYSTAR